MSVMTCELAQFENECLAVRIVRLFVSWVQQARGQFSAVRKNIWLLSPAHTSITECRAVQSEDYRRGATLLWNNEWTKIDVKSNTGDEGSISMNEWWTQISLPWIQDYGIAKVSNECKCACMSRLGRQGWLKIYECFEPFVTSAQYMRR